MAVSPTERLLHGPWHPLGMNCLVVGAGAMGRWFADTVDADPTFVDVDPAAAEAAAAAVGGRAAPADDPPTAEVVCVAVPMPAAGEAVAAYADRATEAVVDVTGAMAGPLSAMREHASNLERLSLHPLFAPERAPGRVAAVVDAEGPTTDAVVADLEAAGNDLLWTTAAEHDRAMESVQTAAHAAVLAYALAVEDVPTAFHTPVSRRLAEAAEMVVGGESRVYADVQATFDGADAVAAAAADLAAADREAFVELYERAGEGWSDGATADGGADE